MPHDDPHILPGAFGDKPKTVPLVVYEKGGTRRVVGEATFTPDESGFHISGAVSDPEMKKLAEADVSGFSITPKFEKENL